MEAIYSSKMSVDFQRATWRYILEDSTVQGSSCYKLPKHIPLENGQKNYV
jgi:hypothetical protein